MTAWNFAWPNGGMHPDYQKGIETAMGNFLDLVAIDRTLCHKGSAEVNLALSMPRGRVNAVLVCSCGVPRAALEGNANDSEEWTFTELGQS